MAKYDFYQNNDGYLLQVRSDLLDGLDTVVVVPLILLANAHTPIRRLNPAFEIEGMVYSMETHFMGTVPLSLLKSPAGNLSERFDEITNALDMLFHGF